MEVFVVETFQYDWMDKKVTSQFLLVETRESAKEIVDEAIKEYVEKERKVELAIDEDDKYIYRITIPGVDGLTGEDEFFVGCVQRHVNTPEDVKDLLEHVKK